MKPPGAIVRASGRGYTRYGLPPSGSNGHSGSTAAAAADDDGGQRVLSNGESGQRCQRARASAAQPARSHHRPLSLREEQLLAALDADVVSLGGESADDEGSLRRLAWAGVPAAVRASAWRLLTGYAPSFAERRARELKRKRGEYGDYVASYFQRLAPPSNSTTTTTLPPPPLSSGAVEGMSSVESTILHQLAIDLPRHKLALFHEPRVARRLERALFVWSLRHPAVGYVQGMDDILTVFLQVFIGEAIADSAPPFRELPASVVPSTTDAALLARALAGVSDEALDRAEADTYWCGGRMLTWMLDHYVAGQPGIRALLSRFERLLRVVEREPLNPTASGASSVTSAANSISVLDELAAFGVGVVDACFQWMHCLLARELPPPLAARLWDTYLSLGAGFVEFHVYVCAALLLDVRPTLLGQPLDVLLHRCKCPKPFDEDDNCRFGLLPAGLALPSTAQLRRTSQSQQLAAEAMPTPPSLEWLDALVAQAYVLFRRHPPAIVFAAQPLDGGGGGGSAAAAGEDTQW